MTARAVKGFPLMALVAAAFFAAVTGPGAYAGEVAPSVANLPAPGSYVLQRIQRAPGAALLDAAGKATDLAHYANGAITALGFFYGHCADPAGCPVAWSTFEAAQKQASDDLLLRDKMRLVFVSLDPARDTPAVMRLLQTAENRETSAPWVFLTSRSDRELSPLLAAMGQDIAQEFDADGRRTGAINHMLKVFLIDPSGWVREIYTTAFLTPESLLNDARTLALESPDADSRAEVR